MKSWANLSIPPIDSAYLFPDLSLTNSSTSRQANLERKAIYRMYVCGITPYDSTHLGHAATYLTFDLINRYLRASGAEVRYVQNITDIDDPLLERAKRDGIDWQDLANTQIDLFRSDMVALHVIPPTHYIGVVEAIALVTQCIERLDSAGSIYKVDQDFYFDVHADSEFGSLSHFDRKKMELLFAERGGDPDRVGKRDSLDSRVWLFKREGEPGWESNFGIGRPGWDIECSAIALSYLEPDPTENFSIDIQGGGSDLIFPHHEMSAAQCRVLTGKPFAQSFVHAGMIGFDGEKMSKSKGNLVFVSELISSGVNPMAIRFALMQEHYREDRVWSSKKLSDAQFLLNKIWLALAMMEVAPTAPVISQIISALADDLDTPRVLEILSNWADATISGARGGEAGELSRAVDSLLGLAL